MEVNAGAIHRQNLSNLSVCVRKAGGALVLLSIRFFAGRDEFLWGRLETCGGLAIRLPPLAAPLRAWEHRHRLRLAAVYYYPFVSSRAATIFLGLRRRPWSGLPGCHAPIRGGMLLPAARRDSVA
jgi:hypothetical protein